MQHSIWSVATSIDHAKFEHTIFAYLSFLQTWHPFIPAEIRQCSVVLTSSI